MGVILAINFAALTICLSLWGLGQQLRRVADALEAAQGGSNEQ